jgi:hypothetical protein
MDMDLVVVVSFVLMFTLIIGGVVLLFPLTRKLGLLIESRIGERKHSDAAVSDTRRIENRLTALEDQLRALSARQEFLDDLLVERRPTEALPTVEDRDNQV